jgi:hypothetical protein
VIEGADPAEVDVQNHYGGISGINADVYQPHRFHDAGFLAHVEADVLVIEKRHPARHEEAHGLHEPLDEIIQRSIRQIHNHAPDKLKHSRESQGKNEASEDFALLAVIVLYEHEAAHHNVKKERRQAKIQIWKI